MTDPNHPNDESDQPQKDFGDLPSQGSVDETLQWSDSAESDLAESNASEQTTTEITPEKNEATRVFAGAGKGKSESGKSDRDDAEGTQGPESFAPIRPFGIGDDAKELDATVPNLDATIDMGTIELRPKSHQTRSDSPRSNTESVMFSADVSQTIDPRALSKEDAAFWGSAAIGASKANKAEQSKLRPAVERSFAESKLQIRERDLAVPTRDKDAPADYRLVRLLGRGGMGNVYVARQSSLDRMIAVKVIKPLPKAKRESLRESGRLGEVEHERRQQFLSEAVVTGDLDHPNIVPIHDIAVAADNTLFYAMKRVIGEPWSKSIDDKSRDENLEILLKVCDAIAFAHTRGVIHRDIKPENIMLGDFGEVLVMDWGLAIAKPEFEKKDAITFTAGLGGTPAFMAPEMAIGPVDSIGTHSDIYLLGATLYYIVVGHAPHKAANVSQCIRAVADNRIEDAPRECQGELLDIARKAMATKPGDRFESVQAFQQAIRSYRSHSESIAISTAAEKEYENAIESSRYESFSRASHGFEQAIALWPGNQAAIEGLDRCRLDHAKAAYENGDFDLGLSLLSTSDSQHLPTIEKLREGLRQRELRASRLKLFRVVAAASLAIILIGGSAAMYWINRERNEAERQREIAQQQKEYADEQTVLAIDRKEEAERQTGIAQGERDRANEAEEEVREQLAEVEKQKAMVEEQRSAAVENAERAIAAEMQATKNAEEREQQRLRAVNSEQEALAALERAKYEAYLSQIGLAKARVDSNEFDDARAILQTVRQSFADQVPPWEWRYLWQLANQSRSALSFDSGIIDVALADRVGIAVIVCDDGSARRADLRNPSVSDWQRRDLEATCAATLDDGRLVAVGTGRGEVLILDPATGQTIRKLQGHEAQVTGAEFLVDGRLLTTSNDRTMALWNPDQQQRLSRAWHIGPVTRVASQQRDGDVPITVITAVGDAKTGRVVGWKVVGDQLERSGVYSEHEFPVVSLALSSDGQLAASGDSRGHVHTWRPADLKPTDFEAAIGNAIARIENKDQGRERLVASRSASLPNRQKWQAHADAISVLCFDESDDALLTGSDDYTISSWNLSDQTRKYTLRGHGGWIRGLDTLTGFTDSATGDTRPLVLSGSVDGTLRTWKRPEAMLTAADSSGQEPATLAQQSDSKDSAGRENQLHRDEILAARLDTNGRRLISASRDHTARIVGIDPDTLSFREIARFNTREKVSDELSEGTEFLAMSAYVDRDGEKLFVGSADSTIRIWNVGSGTQLGILSATGLNHAFALSGDGRRLVSGSSLPDARALLWDVDLTRGRPRILHRFQGHDQAVTAYAISSDGSLVVTGDRGGRCLVWDGVTGQPIDEPIDLLRGFRINELLISKDDSSLWVASDVGQLVEIDLQTRQVGRRLDHEGFVTAFSLSPRGDQAVTISAETSTDSSVTTATWWDLTTLRQRTVERVEAPLDQSGQASSSSAKINSVRFADRGNLVVLCRQGKGGRTGRVSIIDLQGNPSRSFELPSQIGAPETGFLLGSDQLITINGEAAFRWSIDGMTHQKSYRPHSTVTDACFSPDGKIAATASRSLRLWETETGAAIDKLENPHRGAIRSMDFSSRVGDQGYLIATCGDDPVAKIWAWKDRATGFELVRELAIDESQVVRVLFSPSGEQLMIAGNRQRNRSGEIQLRDPADGRLQSSWALPEGIHVTCAAFSKDGQYLAVGASDKTAWLFDLRGGKESRPSVMRGHADRIESISVMRDASDTIRVFTASRDKSARVWDPRLSELIDEAWDAEDPISGREILALRGHSQGVTAIECTADGRLVMTAARDGKVLLWPASLE